ncbi:MAG: hypothetical protein IJS99_06340 [Synergistaceae bacterium]|nr:hypothetical protein [Synergistaceae bacterium]
MRRKFFISIILVIILLFTMGASKENNELKRMSTFISNFTEANFYDFDVQRGGNEGITHLGSPSENEGLIFFGIAHNIINNSKTRIKNCPDKKCEYGPKIIDSKFVAESVKKFFDLPVKHASILGVLPEGADDGDPADEPEQAHFDGKNYHFNPATFQSDTLLYAEVQKVSRQSKIITMTGEIYHSDNPSIRPAAFTATAKPYKFANKDTWAILSLKFSWKE